jgi:pimeloyl-ACP methyl ester carboxylesterase
MRVGAALPSPALRPPRALALPIAAWALGARTPEAHGLVAHFLETRSPAFVKWALGAIAAWRPEQAPPCPVLHVHGAADRLIPVARVRPTRIVPGAGHLLNVTHPREANALLESALTRSFG